MSKRPTPLKIVSTEEPVRERGWRHLRARHVALGVGLVLFIGLGIVFSLRDKPRPAGPIVDSTSPVVAPKPATVAPVLPTREPAPNELIAAPPREVPSVEYLAMLPREWKQAQSVPEFEPKKADSTKLLDTKPPSKRTDLESFRTPIGFHRDVDPALAQARAEGKLVLVAWYAGTFRDGAFTCPAAEEIREKCWTDRRVDDIIARDYVCAAASISGQLTPNLKLIGGSIATYLLLEDGTPIHVIPGPVSGADYAKELEWAIKLARSLPKDDTRLGKVRQAHALRYSAAGGPDLALMNWMLGIRSFISKDGATFMLLREGEGSPEPILPRNWPLHVPRQVEVHWLFAARKGPLEKLDQLHHHIYLEVLDELIHPPN